MESISIRYDARMHKSKSALAQKRRGRKQPLEVEVKLIASEEGTRGWEETFKLHEAGESERSHNARDELNGREYDQLSLF